MKPRVLFLCTANSARSQIAEALLRDQAGERFDVFSAGTAPDEIAPGALEALRSYGVEPVGLESKAIDSFAGEHFDYIITLCSRAQQECQNWPGHGVVMNWDYDDPRESKDPKAYIKTLQAIQQRIKLFIEVNSKAGSTLSTSLTAVDFYKALADEVRLTSLLLILQNGELCVCELTAALEQSQPKISRHLAQLRKSGLLLDRRQGQWVFYRLHPLLNDWMLRVLQETSEHSPELLKDATVRLEQMADRPSTGGSACTYTTKAG
ncbi:metalloregulator ArsR/SmtB family transcription factor [Marinobacterium sp. YM272]|uniref:metalloregulator ArsR/SmtB family transcription factor n=1 Tax=Marinobacterium sp. YM272 TaxID=3421654 RepID=UPI003D7FDC1D